jgi:hypothetical protein
MAEIVGSLFGITADQYERQLAAQDQARAIQMANLAPGARGSAMIQTGAAGLGRGIGRLLGAQDPQLQLISARNQAARQIDPSNPESFMRAAQMLAQMGDTQGATALADAGRKAQAELALIGQRTAAQQASLATAAKTQLSVDQENKLRTQLATLGPNATEEQIRGVLVQYGDPDKVLTALTSAATRAEDRASRERLAKEASDARVEAAKVAADARVEAAREAGANRLQIAQIQADNKRELAQLVASLKGPSPAVLKAQEKAEKVAEGKETLGDILSTAQTLVKDLKATGGMSSTSAGAVSNLITSTQTGTAGQFLGSVFGTEAQSKRDQLKSVRLQLLNAIKEATGMSAQQLNSNVELQTYLKSLGSEGMTAEANLAIIDNLSKTYLGKSMMGAPSAAPATTPGSGLSAAEQAELDQLRSRFGRRPQ